MSVSTFTQPDYTAQTGATYKANLDGAADVMKRLGAAFAPHAQSTPDMTVRLDAGAIFDGATLTEVAAQSTGAISAPAVARIDRVVVDKATGAVSVITGVDQASPPIPDMTAGKVPICRVSLVVSQSSIVNADITDERQLGLLGLGSLAVDDINGLTEDTSPNAGADFVATHDASAAGLKKVKLANLGITDDVARNNILLNAFRIAVNGGLSVLNMQDGVVDEFEDETGVDTAASTNETYDAAGDFYNNPAGSETDADGSGSYTSSNFTLFNRGRGLDNNKTVTKVGIYLAAAFTIAIKVCKRNSANDYNIISTENFSHGGTGWEDFTLAAPYAVPGSGEYLIACYVPGNTSFISASRAFHASDPGVQNNFTTADEDASAEVRATRLTYQASDMTLISNGFTAEAVPTEARIVLFEEDVDAITLNTDLKAFASRDGATYTQITLADEGDYETNKRILTGTADISGQPSGTSMKWKVETLNDKELRLHGVALQWS